MQSSRPNKCTIVTAADHDERHRGASGHRQGMRRRASTAVAVRRRSSELARCTGLSRSRSRRGPVPRPSSGRPASSADCAIRATAHSRCGQLPDAPAASSRSLGMDGGQRHLRRRLGRGQTQRHLAQPFRVHWRRGLGRLAPRRFRRQRRLLGIGDGQLEQRQLLEELLTRRRRQPVGQPLVDHPVGLGQHAAGMDQLTRHLGVAGQHLRQGLGAGLHHRQQLGRGARIRDWHRRHCRADAPPPPPPPPPLPRFFGPLRRKGNIDRSSSTIGLYRLHRHVSPSCRGARR